MAGDTLTRPNFSANGLWGWMGKHGRHILFGTPIQVSGGDYGSGDQDIAATNAIAYPQAVVLINPATGLPVAPGGGNTAYDAPDASGTVATGGTFQQVFAANPARVQAFIQNPTTATEALYVHWTSATPSLANSASLGPGASWTAAGNGVVITGAIKVTAPTTGHAFVASGA